MAAVLVAAPALAEGPAAPAARPPAPKAAATKPADVPTRVAPPPASVAVKALAPPPAAPTPVAGIVVSVPAPLADWRRLDAENTLVIDTDRGQIVIELRPEFAPSAVARVKRLARSGLYDGLQFHRVVDGFMAQTGAPNNLDGGKSQEPDLPPEFTFRLSAEIPRAQLARPQGESEGFIGAQPYVAVDELRMAMSPDRRVSAWGAYCAGVVGMGHDADPSSGNSGFFIMRAPTRSLDRGYSVVGRVVVGLDVVRALTVGDPPQQPSRMQRVRVLADLPERERPRITVLNTLSPEFRYLAARVRTIRGADFSICDIEVPVRATAAPAPPPKKLAAEKKPRPTRRKEAEASS
jgi:peptidylprolyl isomerase